MSNTDPTLEAVKAIPPTAVISAQWVGITFNDLIMYGSALLIALQLFFLLRREVYLPWRAKCKNKKTTA